MGGGRRAYLIYLFRVEMAMSQITVSNRFQQWRETALEKKKGEGAHLQRKKERRALKTEGETPLGKRRDAFFYIGRRPL